MPLLPGQTFGLYQIQAALGSGGMGEVYRAWDPRFGRLVALKVLPRAFAEDPARIRRFRDEARILAALDHPAVVRVHEGDERDGQPFLAMEYVEGATLRQILGQGPMAWREAAATAAGIAGGLAAAHAKGIVHRDLKPENVILTPAGQPKIVDFGLARRDSATPDPDPGGLLGTSGYMSPEQVMGRPLDGRSDLFALGALLYELVTGRRAFEGEGLAETLTAILRDAVPPSGVPGPGGQDLDTALERLLAKDPARRPPSAHEAARALEALAEAGEAGQRPSGARRRARWWILPLASGLLLVAAGPAWDLIRTAGGPTVDPHVVALLPFDNLTGDPSLEPLGRRIVDLIRQDLRTVSHLRIAPDPAPARGRKDPAARRAAEVRARMALAGRISADGTDLVVTARLVETRTGKEVELGPWRAPRSDPRSAVEEARAWAGGAVAWAFDEEAGFAHGATRSPRLEAYQLLRRGNRELCEDPDHALLLMEKGAGLDPGFVMGRVLLVENLLNLGRTAQAASLLQGLEASRSRFTPIEAVLVDIQVLRLRGDRPRLYACFDQAVRLGVDSPMLALDRAWVELEDNRPLQARRRLEGIPLDGVGPGGACRFLPCRIWCRTSRALGDYATELRMAREGRRLCPGRMEFWTYEAEALAGLGRLADLEGVLAQVDRSPHARADTVTPASIRLNLAFFLHHLGKEAAASAFAEEALSRFQALPPASRARAWWGVAKLQTLLGRHREALDTVLEEWARSPGLWATGQAGCLYALNGQPDLARDCERRLAAYDLPGEGGSVPLFQAFIAARLGEKARAVDLLKQAADRGVPLAMGWYSDPDLEDLRGYPPFEALMRPKG